MDPFLDLIQLLRPHATLWARIEAAGPWGVSFRQRDDTLFCWVEHGTCQLVRPNAQPLSLHQDDFVLVRTSTPFTLTSDLTVQPEDSETLVASTGKVNMHLGSGTEAPTRLRGGRFVFDSANEDLLSSLLPQVVHIPSTASTSGPLRALLSLNEGESRSPGPGADFVIARLMELILVEVLRSESLRLHPAQTGLLAGLAHPRVARALEAMHREAAHPWTVASLARLCGLSRSGFSLGFRTIMGLGPIEYLQQWRMALAKDELRRGTRSIAEIGLVTGFQSASAFSTAFSRTIGCSPKRYAAAAKTPATRP